MRSATTRMMTVAAAAMTLGVPVAYSQSGLKANIPFEFRVGKATLAAGNYEISNMTSHGGTKVVKVYGDHGRNQALAVANSPMHSRSDERPRMVFSCDKGGCALSQIWSVPGQGWRFAVPRPKSAEQERLATVFFSSPRTGE